MRSLALIAIAMVSIILGVILNSLRTIFYLPRTKRDRRTAETSENHDGELQIVLEIAMSVGVLWFGNTPFERY
jgi:hypothetical protein